jgi:hypothetical protein
MKRLLLFCLLCFLNLFVFSQNTDFKLQNYKPVSPSAFSFLKYSEMPVSQFAGLADISIPLYTLEEDGVQVPIKLSYHSGGIRVSQESSWVGLGWDLQFGSIVQEINDRDDYGISTVRLLPDWNESPVPSFYSRKYSNMAQGILEVGYNDLVPVESQKARYSYRIYTSYLVSVGLPGPNFTGGLTGAHYYYLPLNGNRDNQPSATNLIENPNYDSELDIFTANFFGHSIKFLKINSYGELMVLNKKGYKVTKNGDVFKIIVPSGEEYHFEQFSTTVSNSVTYGGIGVAGMSNSEPLPSSRMWMLTKIVTVNKRQINFTYSQTATQENYPTFSQRFATVTSSVVNSLGISQYAEGFTQFPASGTGDTYGFSNESKFHLTGINTSNASVTFTSSDRNDVLGGKKLDVVTVSNGAEDIRTIQLFYSYFDATSVGGVKYHPTNESIFGNNPDLRLKLIAVEDNSGARHEFTYDPTPLPSKNSLAQDFWGFYNGQLTNSSLVPNPARLTAAYLCGATNLADNGTNHSASLQYAQAGILKSVKYPTGGNVDFEYELNTFDNYWVPDFNSNTNTISTGNGLRIKAINYQANKFTNAKKTIFSYIGGKSFNSIKLCRSYSISSLNLSITGSNNGYVTSNQIVELCGKGFYSSNSLGSGGSVGYAQVTRQEVDDNGVSLGKIVTNYNIRPDNESNNANGSSQLSIALPSAKAVSTTYGNSYSTYPQNGTVQSEEIYNSQNTLVNSVVNAYETEVSNLYYGARIFGCANAYITAGQTPMTSQWVDIPRSMIGYYPIYDIESKLISSVVSSKDDNNIEKTSTVNYSYNIYNLLAIKTETINNGGTVQSKFSYPDPLSVNNGANYLYNSNRLTEPIQAQKLQISSNGKVAHLNDSYRQFTSIGDKVLLNGLLIKDNPGINTQATQITIDQFDGFGNAVQVTKKGEINSMIWDYTGHYMIADVKNATYSQIAYSSFEADGTGNLAMTSGLRDANFAFTGQKSYNVSNGSISKTGLTPGVSTVVSYWSRNGSMTVNSVSAQHGKTVNGWTYFQHSVIVPSNGLITISGTGLIDELRLYPKNSMMASYVFKPLVGLTSACDQNNSYQFYEYDNTGRLVVVRDMERNVLKKMCYNYMGQIENCLTGCTSYTADWQNTTTGVRCELVNGQNSGYQEQEQKDMNPCSPTFNQLRWVQSGYNTGLCPLPPSCTPAICVGDNKKCINGACETGVRVNLYSSNKRGVWYCYYIYRWSDGSESTTFIETTSTPCLIAE